MFTFGYNTKYDSIVRAVAAIGIGLVLILGGNAPSLVVKIIAVLLMVAGVVSLVYGLIKGREDGMYRLLIINACFDIVLGLLLFFNPQWVANFIVYAIGIVLILFGALQLIVLAGAMSLIGTGFSSLILSICAVVGGAFLLFNPFTLNVMSVIAGCFMLLYGISELISTWRVGKARKVVIEAKEVKYEKIEDDPSGDGTENT